LTWTSGGGVPESPATSVGIGAMSTKSGSFTTSVDEHMVMDSVGNGIDRDMDQHHSEQPEMDYDVADEDQWDIN
jgi:hypothetical protein